MREESRQLHFDADYTTKAIAIGVKPTRAYVTIEQLQKDELWAKRGTNPITEPNLELLDEQEKAGQ